MISSPEAEDPEKEALTPVYSRRKFPSNTMGGEQPDVQPTHPLDSQLHHDLVHLWADWDDRFRRAEDREYFCHSLMLDAHSKICKKLENLSTKFFEIYSSFKLDCAEVDAKINLAQNQLLWLTTLNQDVCREDYEENLAFYAEEIETIEAYLDKLRPELAARSRKRLGITFPREESDPIASSVKKTVPTDEIITIEPDEALASEEPPVDNVATESTPTEPAAVAKVITEDTEIFEEPSLDLDVNEDTLEDNLEGDWTQNDYYEFYGYEDVIDAREESFEVANETKPFGKSQAPVAEHEPTCDGSFDDIQVENNAAIAETNENTEEPSETEEQVCDESFDLFTITSDVDTQNDEQVEPKNCLDDSFDVKHKFPDLRKYEFFDNLIEHPKSTVATDDKPPDVTQTTEEFPDYEKSEALEETAENKKETSCKSFDILTSTSKEADVDIQETVCKKHSKDEEVASNENPDESFETKHKFPDGHELKKLSEEKFFDDKTDAKTDAIKHATNFPSEEFPFDPGITVDTTKPDVHDEEEASSEILSFEQNPKNFSPRPPVSEYPSRMFYFRAAVQLHFSSTQPAQLQNYVVCWGGRPLRLTLRIYIYNYYRPQEVSVSQKWMGASPSTKNLLMSLMKRRLALKVLR